MIHFDESSWKTIWSQQICTHPLCLLLWDQVSAEWCSSERSLHVVLHNWAPARASPQEQKQCSHRVGVGVCVCVLGEWGEEGRSGEGCGLSILTRSHSAHYHSLHFRPTLSHQFCIVEKGNYSMSVFLTTVVTATHHRRADWLKTANLPSFTSVLLVHPNIPHMKKQHFSAFFKLNRWSWFFFVANFYP